MNPATPAHVLASVFASMTTLHYAEPPSFSMAEMVLLAVFMVLSAVGFFWRFDRVLRNIVTARKDPDFHIAPIGKRVWDFFWEVLLQAKVIRERQSMLMKVRALSSEGRMTAVMLTVLPLFTFAMLFIVQERRHPEPVVHLQFFRNVHFSAAVLSVFFQNMVMYSTLILMPQFLQIVQQRSATESGLMLALMSGTSALLH